MLSWSVLFFALAIIAGILGYTELAGAASEFAQILFFVFLGLLIVSYAIRAFKGKDVT